MHMTLTAIDPPGAANRRWRCRDCGLTGTYDHVAGQSCPAAKIGIITPDQQLESWGRGESFCPNTRGECCPDFSCCRPKLGWTPEKRAAFVTADQGTREKMLMESLGAAIAEAGEKAYVTRGEPRDHE